jgi:HAD superfamily hydrolase (TIGR01509 family)
MPLELSYSNATLWCVFGWCNIKPLPGANRLIKHLRSNGVPTALASNSPRSNIEAKISCHQGWKESFSAIVGGDEVEKGKPSPDIFSEAAKRMNTAPSNCLVIEDSLCYSWKSCGNVCHSCTVSAQKDC